MNVIYKYLVDQYDGLLTGKVTLPVSSNVIDIGFQEHNLYVWAIVDTEHLPNTTKDVEIEIYGTGQGIKNIDQLTYLKTIHVEGYVWHVFIKNV